MNTAMLERSLSRLGGLVDYPGDIELLIVGGAAGMLTGVLSRERITTDCDVMVYAPAAALTAVESAAERVGAELNLPNRWLNSDLQIRIDALPDGWRDRRIFVGAYGRLTIFAASRPDLIAMKVLAGRPQDIEDLQSMRIRSDEAAFVRRYLQMLSARGTPASQIDDAHILLSALEGRSDD